MAYVSYSSLNTLGEVSFIAGTTFYLDFQIYSYEGDVSPVSLTNKVITWRMSPYGQKDLNLLQKQAVNLDDDPTTARVTLLPDDTASLSGKFIHQIIIDSMEPSSSDPDEIRSSLALTASPQTIVLSSAIPVPTVPRRISITGGVAGMVGNVTIHGINTSNNIISEDIALNGTNTIFGLMVFKRVDSIDYPAYTNPGDTVSVGVGSYYTNITYKPSQGTIIISPAI